MTRAIYDEGGNLSRWGNFGVTETVPAGHTLVEVDGSPVDTYWAGGQVRAYSASQAMSRNTPPPFMAIWSNASMDWVDLRTLAEHKVARWSSIKAAREASIEAPLVTPYGTFDADSVARTNISNAVMLSQTLEALGQPSLIDFTRSDNSVVTLTAAQMVEVGLLLGQQVQAAHAAARQRRTLIEAATTVGEVLAVPGL
jgi:hypothetical protein